MGLLITEPHRVYDPSMEFKLACGHTRRIHDRFNFFTVIREGCMRCLLEDKATKKATHPKEGKDVR